MGRSGSTSRGVEVQPRLKADAGQAVRAELGRLKVMTALAAVIAVGTVVRLVDLGGPSLWLDELYSVASSTGWYPDSQLPLNQVIQWPDSTSLKAARPWWSIWSAMKQGKAATHPPLYIVGLRFWRMAAGDGDAAARGLSVVASVIAMLLIFDAGRLLYGPAAGIWAAALMAVATPQIQYAQEARPYASLLAWGMGALVALVRIEKLGVSWRRVVALGVCVLAMAMTHYFSFGALLMIGAWVVLRWRGEMRWKALAGIAAAAALFMVTWGASLWSQRVNTSFDFLSDRGPGHILRTLGRADRLAQMYLVEVVPGGVVPGLGALVLVGTLVLLWWRRDLLLPFAWLVGTAGVIVALDLVRSTQHLTFIRYTLLASPGLYLLMAGVLSQRPGWMPWRWAGHVLPAVAVAYCIYGLPRAYDWRSQDWRGLATVIHEKVPADEPVVFAAEAGDWLSESLCMGLSQYVKRPGQKIVVLNGKAPLPVLDYLRRQKRIWVVLEGGPENALPGCRFDVGWAFPNVAAVWQAHFDPAASTPASRPAR